MNSAFGLYLETNGTIGRVVSVSRWITASTWQHLRARPCGRWSGGRGGCWEAAWSKPLGPKARGEPCWAHLPLFQGQQCLKSSFKPLAQPRLPGAHRQLSTSSGLSIFTLSIFGSVPFSIRLFSLRSKVMSEVLTGQSFIMVILRPPKAFSGIEGSAYKLWRRNEGARGVDSRATTSLMSNSEIEQVSVGVRPWEAWEEQHTGRGQHWKAACTSV